MGKTYQVFVNGLKGKTNTIDIGESEDDFKRMTVLSLKKKVVEKVLSEVGDTCDLRLLFSNEQLEDKKTLADYGIQDRSTILAVLGLVGGGMYSE
ncbi:ubiquitin-60S ribosomal protein L40-like [Amblyraja radiata]|uniref:ubiquitin-60S ribosomal protein L40-like n=1 Tax=Amblyraja radiata TaxID=386614 RepID=UPI0014025F9E|nr:ubiquitin-60S ribosomal protein L40-like [Amblyraja radiata]